VQTPIFFCHTSSPRMKATLWELKCHNESQSIAAGWHLIQPREKNKK
jgi:hypothetical protein